MLYAIETIEISDQLKELIMLNRSPALTARGAGSVGPTAAEAAGGWAGTTCARGDRCGLLALGVWFFNREAPRVAEEL